MIKLYKCVFFKKQQQKNLNSFENIESRDRKWIEIKLFKEVNCMRWDTCLARFYSEGTFHFTWHTEEKLSGKPEITEGRSRRPEFRVGS